MVHYMANMQLQDIALPANWIFNYPKDFVRVGKNSYQIVYQGENKFGRNTFDLTLK